MSTTDSTCSASAFGDDSSVANETTTTAGAIVPSPSRGGSRSVSFRLNDSEANNYGNLSASSRRRLVEQRLAAAHGKPSANTNHNGPQGQDSLAKLHPTNGGPQLKDDATSLGTLTTSFSIDSDGEDDRKPAARPISNLHPTQGGPQLEESSIITSSSNGFSGAHAYSYASAAAAASAASSSSLMASEDDDIESGKVAKSDALVKSSSKTGMPTARATVVRSIPSNAAAAAADHDEEMGPQSDRDLAAIINQENLVEAKLIEEEEAGLQPPKKKKSKRKSKAKAVPIPTGDGPPKRYCFNHLKRRGCIGLVVLATLVLVAVIVAAVSVSSKSKSSATSAAVGGEAEETTAGENLPTIEVDYPDPEKEQEDYVPPVVSEVDLTPPEEQDSEKMAALKRVIQFYDITPLSTLTDPTTPQYAALDWLANKDSGASYSSADDVRILQRYVLATLYYSTGGANWNKNYGFLSDEHECKWFEEEKDWVLDMTPITHGIKCGDEGWFDFEEGDDEHIMEIRLESNNLDGPLPSEINALYLLQGLYLSNNKLRSDLAEDIFDIPNLREIELQQNAIFAKLPTKLPEALEKIDMTSNRLVGEIPSSIWILPNLRFLSLGGNKDLTGSIRAEVDQTNLQVINLNDVDLSGSSLPESLAMLDLVIFEVANCGLSGTLPDIFERSDDLQIVNLSKNSIEGSIPVSLDRLHTNLSVINLEDNLFSGDIPWGLTKNIALSYLGLASNQFTGTVPWQFRFFLYLNTLTLHNNNLYGQVDNSLCYINQLTADCSGEQPELSCSCCICDAE